MKLPPIEDVKLTVIGPDDPLPAGFEPITIVVKDVSCPKCGAGEMHPDGKHVLIRGFKVCDAKGHWWSQCLVCAGGYDADLNPVKEFDRNKGWF
jgi:hypothetical protein